mmetsp:Transcript_57075/g.144889  ORF Transcript_57075/g.144889 Transcript_57075/m.144889 type:complete len:465 (-) Transcript_57075:234-1628(-)
MALPVDSPASEAVAFLRGAGAERAPDIAALLAHADEEVREFAAERLEDLEGAVAAPAVAALAMHQEAEVREQAVSLLAGMGEAGTAHVGVVASRLDDTEPGVRAAAAEAIAKLRAEKFTENVAKLMSDNEGTVRGAAAKALAQLGPLSDTHMEAFAGLLADADVEVYCSAMQALPLMGQVGHQYAEQVAKRLADDDWRVRAASVRALGSMGPVGATHLAALANLLSDRKVEVSRSAARALAQLGGPGATRSADLRKEIKVQAHWSRLLDSQVAPTVQRVGEHEVWLIRGLLSRQECAALVAASEGHGFGGTDYPKEYRGNLRLIATDLGLAEIMWTRLQPLVPTTLDMMHVKWQACGLNECWRLSKYHPSDRFEKHVDTCFQRSYDLTSMLTVNIYLNDGFGGGSTRFYFNDHDSADFTVDPEAGTCLLFRQPPGHSYVHDGEEVRSGLKYLLRSDVMYQRQVR